ncbi:MAG: glycosyltransferase family 2 protein [Acidimicrobiales bacterium]
MTLVSVCVATYRRPDGLRALMHSIEAQELPDGLDVEVIIVDNDPPSAEPAVREYGSESRFVVHYLSQPEPNISLTRNAGVAAARGDLVWFVDDDEIAEPDCLGLLVAAMYEHDADVVFGPVLPRFETPLPDWLQPLFSRPVFATGTPSVAHRTGNTLVTSESLSLVEGPFDPAYGVTGGSDSLLFRQLEARGRLLINSADAIVSEVVPAERATWQWLRSRMRRQGQNYARQTVTLEEGTFTPGVAWMSAKALVQIVGWGGSAIASWRDRTQRSLYVMRIWTNIGKIEGVIGVARRRDP